MILINDYHRCARVRDELWHGFGSQTLSKLGNAAHFSSQLLNSQAVFFRFPWRVYLKIQRQFRHSVKKKLNPVSNTHHVIVLSQFYP